MRITLLPKSQFSVFLFFMFGKLEILFDLIFYLNPIIYQHIDTQNLDHIDT